MFVPILTRASHSGDGQVSCRERLFPDVLLCASVCADGADRHCVGANARVHMDVPRSAYRLVRSSVQYERPRAGVLAGEMVGFLRNFEHKLNSPSLPRRIALVLSLSG